MISSSCRDARENHSRAADLLGVATAAAPRSRPRGPTLSVSLAFHHLKVAAESPAAGGMAPRGRAGRRSRRGRSIGGGGGRPTS